MTLCDHKVRTGWIILSETTTKKERESKKDKRNSPFKVLGHFNSLLSANL